MNLNDPLPEPTDNARTSNFVKGHKKTRSHDYDAAGASTSSASLRGAVSEQNLLETEAEESMRRMSMSRQYIESEHLFDAHVNLDPALRPTQPDPNSEESMQIYNEHRRLALQYFRLHLEYQLYLQRKQELCTQSFDNNAVSLDTEYRQLLKEKEELIQLRDSFQGQLDAQRRRQRQRDALKDGDWVYVDKTNFC